MPASRDPPHDGQTGSKIVAMARERAADQLAPDVTDDAARGLSLTHRVGQIAQHRVTRGQTRVPRAQRRERSVIGQVC